MAKQDDLISRLRKTFAELDSSQKDYISKLEQSYQKAVGLHEQTKGLFRKKYVKIHKEAKEAAAEIRKTLIALIEIEELNEIDYSNQHIHYFIETADGKLYETCSDRLAKLPGTSYAEMEIFALVELESLELDKLKKKSKKEIDRWFYRRDPGAGQVNIYGIKHPLNNTSPMVAILKAAEEHQKKRSECMEVKDIN